MMRMMAIAQPRSNLRLFLLWTAQLIRQLRRNPQTVFFTILLPLLILLLFIAPNHAKTLRVDGGFVSYVQYFVPAIAAFAVVTSCLTGLVISVANERSDGVLRRVRSTPLRPGVYIAARIAALLVLTSATVVVFFAVGVIGFGMHLYPRLLPAAVLTFVVGATAFCSLAMALTTVVPNGDAAPAIVNLVVLPMVFISGVFSPLTGAPQWLLNVADALPLRHFVRAFGGAFSPYTAGWGFAWNDLWALVFWGGLGAFIAVKWFRWEPSTGRTRSDRGTGPVERLLGRVNRSSRSATQQRTDS
jgi:ABC-2 type transport system permease protein